MKPFFTEDDFKPNLQMEHGSRSFSDCARIANAKILPLVGELRSLRLMVEGNEIEYASLKQENERLREQVVRLEEALRGLVYSEALKEAPFYSYCESIVRAREALEGK